MTQPQFYPPQPGYPQAPQFQQPAYQQPVQPQFPVAPQIPSQPLANGTLDDFYSQPSTGGGPSISWKGKPDGTTYIGIVGRDVTSGDVQHDTDPQTKQPKYFRDGRPMFSMKVPLKVQHPEFPEGDANLWIRGSLRDELSRAMSEAGVQGSPKAGDVLQVTLVQRKPTQGGIPANVFAIRYQRQGVEAPAAPAAQPPVTQVPVQQAQPVQPVQYAQQPAAQAIDFSQVQPVQQVAPVQPVAPVAPAVPAGISDDQAALLAKLTGQAQG